MRRPIGLCFIGLTSILLVIVAQWVCAATFTVDFTPDAVDAELGNGVCDDGTGRCTLRAAIEEANAFVGDDTINIPAGIYTLNLGSELTIDSEITLNGTGMGTTIIQAAAVPDVAASRVFNVVAGAIVVITDMTIRHGVTPSELGGSGILIQDGTATLERTAVVENASSNQGAISVLPGTLTLISSDVHGNDGRFGHGFGQGGGIFNFHGTVHLQHSTVIGNSALSGGGIFNLNGNVYLQHSTVTDNNAESFGGIVSSTGTLTLLNSTVAENTALSGSGGGIANVNGGSLKLVGSAVLMNRSRGRGGGILNQGPLTIEDSVIASNATESIGGGGVYNQGGFFRLSGSTISGNSGAGIWNLGHGTVLAVNSTVSGNFSSEAGGGTGGIENVRPATATLFSCTVVGNESTLGLGPGGVRNTEFGTVKLINTILAANSSPGDGPDCSGFITSLGHNIVGNVLNCGFRPSAGDVLNVDPLLGPLADNGGPSETHALLPGSPAIDAGPPNCPPPFTDQRGVARPQGTACDIGAYEAEVGSIDVEIDIKPGSNHNPVNPRSRGRIAVAVLTTEDFDADTADVSTVEFGPGGAQPLHYALEDVDGDTDWDLIFHFKTQETGIDCGDTEATLTGKTLDGVEITGTDSIKTAGCKKK
jgi:hypothetical protein